MAVNYLIENARKAMEVIEGYGQEQVNELTKAIAKTIYEHAEELAKLAVDETNLGRIEHKIVKNQNMATNIYASSLDKKTVGIIREIPEEGLIEIAHPLGVIGSVTPTTNPTITPLGNSLMAIKGKNAIIVSPHPRSKETTTKTIELMRDALASIGAPRDLIQVIPEPTIEISQELMKKSDVIVATGGPSLVQAAYSSGHPAYGVGPGNVQAILDRDFDVAQAVELSIIGRSFDNGIVCACQQSLFYPHEKETEVLNTFRKQKAVIFTEPDEVERLRKTVFQSDGKANPLIIGQSAHFIAKTAGLSVPEDTEVIGVVVKKSGQEEFFSKEKMCPVLVMRAYDTFEDAVGMAQQNLQVEGAGHSVGLFSNEEQHIRYAGLNLPVSRIVINQPTIDAGGSPSNGLNPTVSLGCGSWGNNSISENLSFKHLINISRIAKPIEAADFSDLWA